MGGFALYDADKSFLHVLDEHTFEELDQTGEIEWPTITENEIQDRSKADIFSKGIVLLQTTWFIVQCISRFATKLAVTELEVVTLAFAVLNGITYWLWWDKPSDVRCAVPVYLKSAEESSNPKVSEARRQRDTSISESTNPTRHGESFLASLKCSFRRKRDKHGLFLAMLYTLLWVPIKAAFSPLRELFSQEIPGGGVTRFPKFYSPFKMGDLGFPLSTWTMIGVTSLFGAIHFIPWPSTFLTTSEKWLWRVSVIMITGGPLLTMFPIIIGAMDCVSNPILKNILDFSARFMVYTLAPVYIFSRIILLILPLVLLRSLHPTALLELKWSEFFPHL